MTDQSPEEIAAQFQAWQEFKKTIHYQALIEAASPFDLLLAFLQGWRAAKKQVEPMPEEVMTGSDIGL